MPQKFQKFGGGGAKPALEETQSKAAFFILMSFLSSSRLGIIHIFLFLFYFLSGIFPAISVEMDGD